MEAQKASKFEDKHKECNSQKNKIHVKTFHDFWTLMLGF